ncbi:MAG TPA: response regulator [Spirochaetia bacterium]|nr:MAG: hypothetical protein A2Y41_08095 [Spirochaetes bacterium GWB1_36_13]HCL56901.1 response regulator [Spirochaetia bacterium]
MENKLVQKDIRVLYVEDDEMVRKIFILFLKRRFEDISVAENGLEGYKNFLEKPFDLIITDIQMPVMNGLEMALKIREKNKIVPIVITSAFNDQKYQDEAKKLNIHHYIQKPIILDEMNRVFDEIISNLTKI